MEPFAATSGSGSPPTEPGSERNPTETGAVSHRNLIEAGFKLPETTTSQTLPSLTGIANPVHSVFPNEPPPAYGPQTSSFPMYNVGLDATTATNAAIMMNGRSSVAVVCPFCSNSVLTVTSESESPALSSSRSRYYSIGGSLLFIFFIFGILIFMAGYTITLYVMPGLVIFLLFSTIWISHQRNRAIIRAFADITHTCPLCNKKLGVSSGYQFLQMTHQNDQRY